MAKKPELNVYTVPFFNEKILVLKRHNGIWEFPGGGVVFGEKPEQTALRELKEETSLSGKNLSFLGITSAVYEKDEKEKHSVYIVYKCEVDSDAYSTSLEHEEGRWLTINELKYLKLGLNVEPILDML